MSCTYCMIAPDVGKCVRDQCPKCCGCGREIGPADWIEALSRSVPDEEWAKLPPDSSATTDIGTAQKKLAEARAEVARLTEQLTTERGARAAAERARAQLIEAWDRHGSPSIESNQQQRDAAYAEVDAIRAALGIDAYADPVKAIRELRRDLTKALDGDEGGE